MVRTYRVNVVIGEVEVDSEKEDVEEAYRKAVELKRQLVGSVRLDVIVGDADPILESR
jgi:hypothetical protein